jgi:hippurate hydrolase
MIEDGLMDRFRIDQVYGMHNGPGIPLGSFAIRPGPIMAATDAIDFKIEGYGGHAARPHLCIDPVLAGAQLIIALQSIVSRNVDPLESAVISICEFEAGKTRNVIPQTVELRGTVRTLKADMRDMMEKRIREVTAGVAQTTGTRIDLNFERGYPVTVNHAAQTDTAIRIAKEIAGDTNVHDTPPMMGAEDSPTCWKPGPAPSSSSAMATARGCIIPPTTSTTTPSSTAPRTGSGWSRTRWRSDQSRAVAGSGT